MIDAICKTFAGMGVDPEFATRLHALFRQAGFNAAEPTSGTPLGQADDTELLTRAVESWRSVYQMAGRLGLVTDELADPDTLLSRAARRSGQRRRNRDAPDVDRCVDYGLGDRTPNRRFL